MSGLTGVEFIEILKNADHCRHEEAKIWWN